MVSDVVENFDVRKALRQWCEKVWVELPVKKNIRPTVRKPGIYDTLIFQYRKPFKCRNAEKRQNTGP